MQIRHERRRRVMIDESVAGAAGTDKKRANGRPKAYGAGAQREQQPRLIDLVPRRYLTITLLGLLGAIVIGLLELAYARLPQLAGVIASEDLTVFDLTDRRSLANCYRVLLVLLASGVALLVYSLRRHRIDDYHGRYRIWLWTALAGLTLAVHQATGALNVVRSLFFASIRRFELPAQNLWLALCATALLILAVRLTLEIRRCRFAMLTFLGGAALLISAATTLPQQIGGSSIEGVLIRAGAQMAGNLLMLLGAGLYARHVVREVEGLVSTRRKKLKDKLQKRALNSAENSEQGQAKQTSAQPAADRSVAASAPLARNPGGVPSSTSARPTAVPSDYDDDDDESDDSSRGLSRAERKRLRREKKLEQRRAA